MSATNRPMIEWTFSPKNRVVGQTVVVAVVVVVAAVLADRPCPSNTKAV